MKHTKIILAADLSANSAFAAKWAQSYAQQFDAHVVLLHIVELNVPNWLRDRYNVVEDAQKKAAMEQKLSQWYATHTGGTPGEVMIQVGNVQDVLSQLPKEIGATMLVLARSSKSSLTKFLAGSTAQMMAATPPCVVTIVHPDHTSLGADTRIAVATDLTESAETAVSASAALASTLGARLDIIHAHSRAQTAALAELGMEDGAGVAALQTQSTELLDAVVARHAAGLDGVDYHAHVLDDQPVDAMETFVDEHNVDLSVVGNAASYNVLTNIFGRVSVKLTQVLSCTVMVVPPEGSTPA